MKKTKRHETAPHNLYYSEVCINLLLRGLERMKEEKTTIEQFHMVLKRVQQLHKVQMEIIDIEESLQLPSWNGEYTIFISNQE
jgi:hypothetical protein